MTARTRRRRRQRRIAVAAVTAAALAVAIAMGVLWRQSEGARAEAVTAARRAEAQQLFTLGQSEIDRNPTAAVAYALASLERDDSPHARRLALRALWQGPPAFVLARTDESWGVHQLSFSNDGDWLAGVSDRTGTVRLWRSDGSAAREIPDIGSRGRFAWGDFAEDSRSFVVTTSDAIRMYSLPDANEIRRIAGTFRWGFVRGQSVVTGAFVEPTPDGRARRLIRSYPLPEGTPETTRGSGRRHRERLERSPSIRRGSGCWVSTAVRSSRFPLPDSNVPSRGWLFAATTTRSRASLSVLMARGSMPCTSQARGGCGRAPPAPLPEPHAGGASRSIVRRRVSADGRWLAAAGARQWTSGIWRDRGGRAARPAPGWPAGQRRHRSQRYLAGRSRQSDGFALAVDDAPSQRPARIREGPSSLVIDPHGGGSPPEATTRSRSMKIWPLQGEPGIEGRTLDTGAPIRLPAARLAAWGFPDRRNDGRRAAHPARWPPGRASRRLQRHGHGIGPGPDGRQLAAGGGVRGELAAPGEAVVRVWNLDTREVTVLDAGDGQPILVSNSCPMAGCLRPAPPACASGTCAQDLDALDGEPCRACAAERRRPLRPGLPRRDASGRSGRNGPVYDMQNKRSWDLTSHGSEITSVAWAPSRSRSSREAATASCAWGS